MRVRNCISHRNVIKTAQISGVLIRRKSIDYLHTHLYITTSSNNIYRLSYYISILQKEALHFNKV